MILKNVAFSLISQRTENTPLAVSVQARRGSSRPATIIMSLCRPPDLVRQRYHSDNNVHLYEGDIVL